MAHGAPTDLKIEARDLKFEEAAAAPRWWLGRDPVATAFFNTLSAIFPQGERFFIESVERFRGKAGPELQRQIVAFASQESMHTREHLAFNRIATGRGYDLSPTEARLGNLLAWVRGRRPREQLATTMALEHFTAIVARELLVNPAYLEGAPEPLRRLWQWHALEEIEHKSVAFDTFTAATAYMSGLRRWAVRSSVMVFTTVFFFQQVIGGAGDMFRQDGIDKAGTWLRFMNYMFVRPGVLRRVFGCYLAYYRPGFHPWQIDDRDLIAKFEASFAGAAAAH